MPGFFGSIKESWKKGQQMSKDKSARERELRALKTKYSEHMPIIEGFLNKLPFMQRDAQASFDKLPEDKQKIVVQGLKEFIEFYKK